jgi:hypothetical protein
MISGLASVIGEDEMVAEEDGPLRGPDDLSKNAYLGTSGIMPPSPHSPSGKE